MVDCGGAMVGRWWYDADKAEPGRWVPSDEAYREFDGETASFGVGFAWLDADERVVCASKQTSVCAVGSASVFFFFT